MPRAENFKKAKLLDSDDKVRVTPETIFVHAECAERLARGRRDDESAAHLVVLYFIHELAHLPQGIGAFQTVQRLRTVDEAELLHLDLAADHVAALVLQRLTGIPLADVKRRQAESLCGFPVGASHSAVARSRKARRTVSLCADSILATDPGASARYVLASFAEAATVVTVNAHGDGATRLVARGTLEIAESQRLAAAADPTGMDGARANEVCGILGRAFERENRGERIAG